MLKVIPSAQYAGVNFSYSPEPDSTYIISVDIEMGNSNSTDGIYITAYGVNTVSGQYGPVVVHQPVSGSGHYELTYTAPPDFVGLTKVYFTSGANTDPANPHYFFIDNFAVAKAPGPGGPPENVQCSDNFLTFNRYFPDILQHTDFHAFGMEMNGRKWQGTANNFRFSYNGKESASELASGDYDFGERILDGRVGRWMTWDPLRQKYPGLSPYNFCANNPIINVDERGEEIYFHGVDAQQALSSLTRKLNSKKLNPAWNQRKKPKK
jgi:RHS repeat-associated protein